MGEKGRGKARKARRKGRQSKEGETREGNKGKGNEAIETAHGKGRVVREREERVESLDLVSLNKLRGSDSVKQTILLLILQGNEDEKGMDRQSGY